MLSCVLALLALGCTTSAWAADLPGREPAPPVLAPRVMTPAFTWTGFYAGIHVGGAFGDNNTRTLVSSNPQITPGLELPVNSTGILAGGQVGYNYQSGSWVIGVEGAGSWTDLSIGKITTILPSSSSTCTSFGASCFSSVADSKWLAMATAHVGLAGYQWLLYLKGGVAFMGVDYTTSTLNSSTVVESLTINDTRIGWVVGGGAQLAFLNGWSIRAEYNYIDFSNEKYVFPFVAGSTQVDIYSQIHAFRVGLNYHLNGSEPTLGY
jgi:outer membrane immunogenic protein